MAHITPNNNNMNSGCAHIGTQHLMMKSAVICELRTHHKHTQAPSSTNRINIIYEWFAQMHT